MGKNKKKIDFLKMPKFDVVAAVDLAFGIGAKQSLPWGMALKRDLKHFKSVTTNVEGATGKNPINVVIMGRNTWNTIPEKFRPLPNRINIVLSSTEEIAKELNEIENVQVCSSFEESLKLCDENSFDDKQIHNVFVVGGAQVYREALKHKQLRSLYLTKIYKKFDCDVFFPSIIHGFKVDPNFKRESVIESEISYEFVKYSKNEEKHEEYQYLELIQEIIDVGVYRGDRTGTGTLSLFGKQTRWNLRESFPLLTTKRVFWRGLAEELLWFVAGCTDATKLQDKNVHIWDGNGSREFLDSRGLQKNAVGDLGPVYGFQWRHFGAKYEDCNSDYSGKGVDQLKNIIETIKSNPTDRRMCLSAWNPAALNEMALPPCHMFCQFYVANGELSCHMYQRSCDMGLGVPFNIASYALLTYMVAHVTGLKPGDFVHSMGDAHVYSNHVTPLLEQLKRTPNEFPKLRFKRQVSDIDDFKYEDFELIDYKPQKTIKMEMAV